MCFIPWTPDCLKKLLLSNPSKSSQCHSQVTFQNSETSSNIVIDSCFVMSPVIHALNSPSILFILSSVFQSNVKIQLPCTCSAQTCCQQLVIGPWGRWRPQAHRIHHHQGGSLEGQAVLTMWEMAETAKQCNCLCWGTVWTWVKNEPHNLSSAYL